MVYEVKTSKRFCNYAQAAKRFYMKYLKEFESEQDILQKTSAIYYRTIPADFQANPGYFISVRTKFPISPVTPILTRPPVRIGAFMPGGFMNSGASKNAGHARHI